MLRRLMIGLAASAALAGAALAPNTASAFGGHWGGHGWHYGWRGVGLYAAPVLVGPAYDGCLVRRWVPTAYGPRLHWINVCY